MLDDFAAVAAGVAQSIGENGYSVEGTLVVDCLGQINDDRGEPTRVNSDGTEEVAEDVSQSVCLPVALNGRGS